MAAGSGSKAGGRTKKTVRRPPPARLPRKRRPDEHPAPQLPIDNDADPDAELYEQGDIVAPHRDPPYNDGL